MLAPLMAVKYDKFCQETLLRKNDWISDVIRQMITLVKPTLGSQKTKIINE
jgi:hypothetical protein